ncbi:MAG: phosphatase PAP2 family protein [Micropruina sp.]|nr:phosphatase PAP2 family protein [Micropruina sp.]
MSGSTRTPATVDSLDEVAQPGLSAPALAALVAGAGVYGVWWGAVNTATGQRLDHLAFLGSKIGSWRVSDEAMRLLDMVSVPAVAVAVAVVMLIALLRRRWALSLLAAGVVIGANLTSQALKNWVFTREDLIDLGPYGGLANSLPSGHTTVAASAAVAALLVVPAALRAVTAGLGVVIVTAFGFATLVGQWHRASDAIAAVLVAASWAFAGVVAARIATRLQHREVAARPDAFTVILLLVGLIGVGVAGLAGLINWSVPIEAATRTNLFLAYLGGVAALTGVTCACFGMLLRMVEVSRPAGRPADQG